MVVRSRWFAGLATVAMAAGGATAAAQTAPAAPTVMLNPNGQAVMVDPLMASMMVGSGVPLTRAQAGMAAASTVGNMTGIGSGRLSGVRGAAGPRGNADVRGLTERRPTLRSPAGQASNYFNRYGRATTVDVSSPVNRATTGKYYNRPAGFFPEGVR